jgi:hypothetical protein
MKVCLHPICDFATCGGNRLTAKYSLPLLHVFSDEVYSTRLSTAAWPTSSTKEVYTVQNKGLDSCNNFRTGRPAGVQLPLAAVQMPQIKPRAE